MQIEFQVEEPSMEKTIDNLAPKIIKGRATYKIINYRGKTRLLRELPKRLRAYRNRIKKEDIKIVVLLDEDRKSCLELKNILENFSENAGLYTKSNPDSDGNFTVINRIVIEELEAWFFGDCEALIKCYPRLPENLQLKARYRNPDAIKGGTWEALHRELAKAGYFKSVLPKLEVARNISSAMCPSKNRSKSFQVFHHGLETFFD